MGPRRIGFALFAALVISIGITSVFYLRVTRQQGGGPKTRPVIAAAVALQPGTPITAENLTQISWPESAPLEGLMEKKEDVAGKVLIYAVAKGEPVLRRDLASGGSYGLAAKIPDGMRATAIKTNEVIWNDGRSGFLLNLIAEESAHDATPTDSMNFQRNTSACEIGSVSSQRVSALRNRFE